MSRQALLRAAPPPEYSLILDEAVLRRGFGGPALTFEPSAWSAFIAAVQRHELDS
jgi:hypothetical protein